MVRAHVDFRLNNIIRDTLHLLHLGETEQAVRDVFDEHIQQMNTLDILLILQELTMDDAIITMNEIERFFDVYEKLYGQSLVDIPVPDLDHPGHPISVLKRENEELEGILTRIDQLLIAFERDPQQNTDKLQEQMKELGQFYSHYNRKEKLYFPIIERYGIFTPCRMMWANDDRIRTLYKGTKRMMEKMSDIDILHVKQAFHDLDKAMRDMFLQEKYFLLPIAQSIFQEKDWLAIAKESKAFGYVGVEPEEHWVTEGEENVDADSKETEHFRFGGGFLTLKEANHILNNLPLELTFVDKNGIFKYFNEVVESCEMMFIRTPTSIGRNVKMCHPPKSMRKVMQIIQDLRWKRRESETMWFKKQDKYVHITYKGIFDENDEFLGILEYVQDIQPLFELPRDVKKEVSQMDI